MDLKYTPLLLEKERALLIQWLTTEEWPFHVNRKLTAEKVAEFIESGEYSEPNNQVFWIKAQECDQPVGLIRLFDLEDVEDGTPFFDLRVKKEFRGCGVGASAVIWLTKYVFEKWTKCDRLGGTTREDNLAMRAAFRKCGYVKEAHFRKNWPTSNGTLVDTVQYTILREDWAENKTTQVRWSE
jgi:RimJ/RimL family protein N-acetyltransferase